MNPRLIANQILLPACGIVIQAFGGGSTLSSISVAHPPRILRAQRYDDPPIVPRARANGTNLFIHKRNHRKLVRATQ